MSTVDPDPRELRFVAVVSMTFALLEFTPATASATSINCFLDDSDVPAYCAPRLPSGGSGLSGEGFSQPGSSASGAGALQLGAPGAGETGWFGSDGRIAAGSGAFSAGSGAGFAPAPLASADSSPSLVSTGSALTSEGTANSANERTLDAMTASAAPSVHTGFSAYAETPSFYPVSTPESLFQAPGISGLGSPLALQDLSATSFEAPPKLAAEFVLDGSTHSGPQGSSGPQPLGVLEQSLLMPNGLVNAGTTGGAAPQAVRLANALSSPSGPSDLSPGDVRFNDLTDAAAADVALVANPEPATMVLLGTGLLGVALRLRRRGRR